MREPRASLTPRERLLTALDGDEPDERWENIAAFVRAAADLGQSGRP